MNLYITFEDRSKIKKCFLNLRKYLIINVDEVKESLGYEEEEELDHCKSFILNQEIMQVIRSGSSGRKLLAIVYSNPEMNDETIRELIKSSIDIKNIDNVVFLTEKGTYEEYFELFDEVMFFPTLKKVHLIECESYPVFWADEKELEHLNRDIFLG
jgi:hypothetical protein